MRTAKRYVGFDVHKEAIAVSVRGESGKIQQRSLIETNAEAVITLLRGLGNATWVAFEEGTQAQWLCEICSPYVDRVVVADVRGEKKGKPKSDRLDADELSGRLAKNDLREIFHSTGTVRQLKELVRNYNWLVEDTTRVKNRIQAAYRSRAIKTDRSVYSAKKRSEWLETIDHEALRSRLASLYSVYDTLITERKAAKQLMIEEARRHPAYKIIRQVKFLGPVRISQIIGIVGTPKRFRNNEAFEAYIGLKVIIYDSARFVPYSGGFRRHSRPPMTRGLNKNYNRVLKTVFKSAATDGASRPGPFLEFYQNLVNNGMNPELAKLTLARKIAAVVLRLWKKGEVFDPTKLTQQS